MLPESVLVSPRVSCDKMCPKETGRKIGIGFGSKRTSRRFGSCVPCSYFGFVLWTVFMRWCLSSSYLLPRCAYITGTTSFLNNLRSITWIRVQQYTSREIGIKLYDHLHRFVTLFCYDAEVTSGNLSARSGSADRTRAYCSRHQSVCGHFWLSFFFGRGGNSTITKFHQDDF